MPGPQRGPLGVNKLLVIVTVECDVHGRARACLPAHTPGVRGGLTPRPPAGREHNPPRAACWFGFTQGEHSTWRSASL